MTEEEARRAASVELGSANSVKHQIWSSRWESTIEGILKDLRLSARSLLKSPGFTAVALLSLALGIGGNTAIFTLINQVLLRNLPVRDPQQLVAFSNSTFGGDCRWHRSRRFWRLFSLGFHSQDGSGSRPLSGNRRLRQLFEQGEHPAPRGRRNGQCKFACTAGAGESCLGQLFQRPRRSTSAWPHH